MKLNFNKKDIGSLRALRSDVLAQASETKTPDNNQQPGEEMPDGTIYLGQYEPKDRAGISLGKTFNVFAAPQNMPAALTYVEMVSAVAQLKNWNGYDGTYCTTDKEIYAALKDGTYDGGWIIPTRDILSGKDVDDTPTMADNMQEIAGKETALGNTFSGASRWYWSSTHHRKDPNGVWNTLIQRIHNDGWDDKTRGVRLWCRPVRLVPTL